MENRALFLDRDGIINIDKGYVYKIKDFVFYKDIFKFCDFFNSKGFKIFVITNQSGIARGFYTEEDFINISQYMCKEFKKHNINIEKIYHCPHLLDCECRKPKPGMLLKAKLEYNINMKKSFLIGDKLSDMQAGFDAGIRKLFLIGETNRDFYKNFKNLKECLNFLLKEIK